MHPYHMPNQITDVLWWHVLLSLGCCRWRGAVKITRRWTMMALQRCSLQPSGSKYMKNLADRPVKSSRPRGASPERHSSFRHSTFRYSSSRSSGASSSMQRSSSSSSSSMQRSSSSSSSSTQKPSSLSSSSSTPKPPSSSSSTSA